MKIEPAFDKIKELAERGNLIPICGTVPNDVHTPVSLFMRLAGDSPSFLLESVEGGESVARYSYLAIQLEETLVSKGRSVMLHTRSGDTVRVAPVPSSNEGDGGDKSGSGEGDLLDALRAYMSRHVSVKRQDMPPFTGGLVGYLGYDAVRQFEQLPETAIDPLELPEAAFLVAKTVLAVDHAKHRIQIIANMEVGDRSPEVLREAYDDAVARIKTIKVRLASPLVFPEPNLSAKCVAPKGNKSRHEFEEMVRKAKELIRAGDILQVVLSRRVERGTMAHPLAIYRSLRCLNPSPWMFYIQFGRMWRQDGDGSSPPPLHLIGASPELHASFEVASRKATVTPIAGTRRRGKTEEEDNQLAEELLQDPKERAEHAMLVDLGRNDIGRIAKYGSVEEREKFTIEKYSHVMHIVSRVTGEVREGLDAFDVLRATFPAGTLSGAPKIRAMEIIEDLEGERRGPYGGCAGYFSFSGDMGTCITIRTIVQKGSRCYIQAGAGIVADSDPSREYEETVNKGLALMQTIDEVEQEM